MIFLPVLIGANFSEYKFLNGVFNGKFTDFNDEWYRVIGRQIFVTTLIFSLQTLVDFLVEKLTAKLM